MVCCYRLLSVLWLPLSVPLWYDFSRNLQKGACTIIQVDVHKMAVLCNRSVIFLVKKFRFFNFLMQNITTLQ